MLILPNDLPIAVYHEAAHADPRWLSKTSLQNFTRHSPAWWRKVYIDREMPAPTPGGVAQGNALDCLLTEGRDRFCARFGANPHDGRTKAGKEWQAHADAFGITGISGEDMLICDEAEAAVKALPCWSEIAQAQAQATIRRQPAGLSFGLQSRPDWLLVEGEDAVLWDLKKTRSLDAFGKQAIDLGYHLQAAIARWCLAGMGIRLQRAQLVAVEWERCPRARVYTIPSDVLDHADAAMRRIAADVDDRIKRGDWSDVQEQAETLPVPAWMMARMAS